jgi:hypothetical protein
LISHLIPSIIGRLNSTELTRLKQGILFLLFLILIDQVILFAGDRLVTGPYWKDQLVNNMIRNSKTDAIILGTCRAALHFDPKIIESNTGLSTFNAARVVDGIGNIELTWDIARAHAVPKYVFLVFDDGMWTQPREEAAEDLERHRLEWTKMDADHQNVIAREYRFDAFLLKSGFLKYRGMGEELLKTARVAIKRNHDDVVADGYSPRSSFQNIVPEIENPAHRQKLEEHQLKNLVPQSFSVETIDRIVGQIRCTAIAPRTKRSARNSV